MRVPVNSSLYIINEDGGGGVKRDVAPSRPSAAAVSLGGSPNSAWGDSQGQKAQADTRNSPLALVFNNMKVGSFASFLAF